MQLQLFPFLSLHSARCVTKRGGACYLKHFHLCEEGGVEIIENDEV